MYSVGDLQSVRDGSGQWSVGLRMIRDGGGKNTAGGIMRMIRDDDNEDDPRWWRMIRDGHNEDDPRWWR